MRRPRFVSKLALTAVACGCVPLLHGAEPAKSTRPQAEVISQEVRETVGKVSDAICRIEGDDEHGHLSGTGFFIDADGTLLTSFSVGGESRNIVVSAGEQRFPATRLVADSYAGIAVLKIAANKPVRFLKFGKSSALAVASPVITAGYPLDLPLSPSFGLVAGIDSGFNGRFFNTRHIRANVPVQRGEGGSPVMNLHGEVVGVLISTVEENSGIFALPVEAAEKILHDFRTYGRVRQGWVGVEVRPTDAPEGGSSARILKLREDSPAFVGGIRPGDILLQIGSRRITNPEDVHSAAFFVTAGEPLPVRVSRGGRELKLTVTPLDPPDGRKPSIEWEPPTILSADEPKGILLDR